MRKEQSKSRKVLARAMFILMAVTAFQTWAFVNFANASVEWHFNGSTTEGWTGDDAYIYASDSDNVLYANTYAGANDPRISSPSINITTDSYGIVEIRMSSLCSNKQGYVYFRKSGWSESYKVSFSTSSSWNTYQVDMTNNSYWDGTITAIRIDYASAGDSGECLAAFDWIKILPKNGSISGGVRDYYTGAALSNVAVRLEKNGVIKKGPVYTGSSGTYTISEVPPDTYRLTGLKYGYQNSFIDGKVINSGQNLIEQNLRMKPEIPVLDSFSINNGASSTTSRSVSLNNSVTYSPTHYMASDNSDFSGANWYSYSSSPSFSLSSGFGSKKVYFKVKNNTGESNVKYDYIDYDPSPQVSDNKSSMFVGDQIELYCELGADGPYRDVTFFVDPGSGSLVTYGASTNSSGRAVKTLTAQSDWVPDTDFACRDDDSGKASGYDATVAVDPPNQPPVITKFHPHDAQGNLVTEISHGWNVVTEIRSYDPESGTYSCEYQVNANSWEPTGAINGDFTIPASEFSPGTTKSGYENSVRVRCTDSHGDSAQTSEKIITDYPVPDSAPSISSPKNQSLEPQAEYQFVFSGVDLADHYRWYVSEDSQLNGARSQWAGWSPYVDNQLQTDKTYYWKICAENKLNTQGSNGSSCSSIETFNIYGEALAPPGLVNPVDNIEIEPSSQGAIVFQWNEVSGAGGYQIKISDNDTFTDPLVNDQSIHSASTSYQASPCLGILGKAITGKCVRLTAPAQGGAVGASTKRLFRIKTLRS